MADVYATARGPLARIAGPVAARTRARRHRLLFSLTGIDALPHPPRILDVGCGALGLRAQAPDLDITGVDLDDRPSYPGPFVRADAAVRLPFDDGAFDLVYSSSVVEHVPPERRAAYAREIARVGRGLFVQTPAFSFPIEPHALLPVAHWLPPALRRPYWRLGAQGHWEDVHLLRRREVAALFPGATVHRERLGPLTKSWIVVRQIPAGRVDPLRDPVA
ncbi:MAG: class I SAM-dependent methyltransferase [Solirubrobacteraceae bacterium]|nr:class I SAM-dependent methyltransferase [Solirubrobacteraceae bacterium]